MRILITGGAGFIGSHVVDLLMEKKHDVFVVDNLSTGRRENLTNYTGFADLDILNRAQLNAVVEGFSPDAIIHLAAQAAITTSTKDPIKDLEINAIGTLNVLQAALKNNVKKFIFSSTSAVYDENIVSDGIGEDAPLRPSSPYGISKLAAEFYIRTLFPEAVILRFGNVYGPRQVPIGENQVIARAIRHFEYGDAFQIFGSGSQTRDFIYVKDVARAVCMAFENRGGVFNISSGVSTSINAVIEIISRRYATKELIEHTTNEDTRQGVRLQVAEAFYHFGFSAGFPIETGIWQTIDWWRDKK